MIPLGTLHVDNLSSTVCGAALTAACSIVPDELEYAKETLRTKNVPLHYPEMISDPNIDAVVISTTFQELCWQIETVPDTGKHIFLKSHRSGSGKPHGRINQISQVLRRHICRVREGISGRFTEVFLLEMEEFVNRA